MRVLRDGSFLGMALVFSALAAAAEFDGSAPLTCTGLAGHDCNPGKAQCRELKAHTKTTPKLAIDPANKTIKTPYRTDLLPIQNSVLNDEQLQLQGTAEKFAWSAVINRKTGKITLTVADRVGAYVIFGQCKASGAP